ncbi:MAG: Crp/Fnr family transcriptional regulator [Xanthomonadales bacterium]|nr:Crp/Fnr family transcriptional regulator [Xanthomonadales bacterium]
MPQTGTQAGPLVVAGADPSVPGHGEAATASIHAMHMFSGAAPAAIEAARSTARIERIARDTRIFAQGSPARRAFAVVTGSVRIVQSGADGGQIICCFAARGESFGIAALFNGERQSGDALAAQPCEIASWSQAQLLALIEASPRIAINLIGSLGQCLLESHNRVRELATQRCEQRIAHTLLRLAGQAGCGGESHRAISIPLRRRDVAETAGTTLHTASRALAAWEKCGLLATREQHLMIHDMPALTRIAQGGAA